MKRLKGGRKKEEGRRRNFYFLLFTFYSLLSTVLAVTYNTDPANGPETLTSEVTESFEAWKALDTKLELSVAEENPESLFQYGSPERFSPEMFSITVQRQQETRQLIHLISPNADNRKRILLHEAGIAIGLTAQTTPSLATPQATEESPTEVTSPLETDAGNTGEDSTENTTDTVTSEDSSTSENTGSENTDTSTDQTTEESTGSESTDSTGPESDTTNDSSSENTSEDTESSGTTQDESTSEDTESSSSNSSTDSTDSTQEESTEPTDSSGDTATDSDTETTQEESETTPGEPSSDVQEETTATPSEDVSQESTTPATTIKPWETVMNPSINPDDKTELGEGEKELLKALNLFAKEDINKDGNINFYDLIAIGQAFGQRNVNDPSDLNKDGIVNQADIDVLRKVYTFSDPSPTAPGQTEPSNPEGQTGPEDPNQIPEDDTNTGE